MIQVKNGQQKKRFERFKKYLTKAADQTLGRIKCGKGKRKLKGWWDGKVKEVCRTLRKRKKLYAQCPNETLGNEIKDLERDYQEKKRIAKELVKKKRREEREAQDHSKGRNHRSC